MFLSTLINIFDVSYSFLASFLKTLDRDLLDGSKQKFSKFAIFQVFQSISQEDFQYFFMESYGYQVLMADIKSLVKLAILEVAFIKIWIFGILVCNLQTKSDMYFFLFCASINMWYQHVVKISQSYLLQFSRSLGGFPPEKADTINC